MLKYTLSLENIGNRKSVEYRKKTGIKFFSCISEQLTEQEPTLNLNKILII